MKLKECRKLEENFYISKHAVIDHLGEWKYLESGWLGKRKEGLFTEEEIIQLYRNKLKERNTVVHFIETGKKWVYPDNHIIVVHENNLKPEIVSQPLFIPLNDPRCEDPSWEYFKNNQNIYAPMGRYRIFDKRKL